MFVKTSKKTTDCIVNVSRQGLAMCGPGIDGVLTMPFTAEILNDLDVTNLAELSAQVKNFVESNKIGLRDLILILGSDTYFEKDLTGKGDEEVAQEIRNYVDQVPLVNPSSRMFKVEEDKFKVVVINRRFYESLRTAFEAVGFGVIAVVPELALGGVGVSGAQFDLNACRLIFKSKSHILANSFIGPVGPLEDDNWVNTHKKQSLVLAILGMLIGVLGVGLIVWQTISARNAAIARALAIAARSKQVKQALVPSPTPEVASISANLTDFSLRVLNASQISGQGARVEEVLRKAGFSKILVGTSSQASKSTVVFSQTVPKQVRTVILDILSPILGDMAIIENSQAQFDALITIGKTAP